MFEGEKEIFSRNISHDAEKLKEFKEISDQLPYRKEMILNTLKEEGQPLEGVDAFSARGGGLVNVEGGVYTIGKKLLEHARECYTVKHPATLGAQLADAFSKEFGGAAFVVNPPDVDEFQDVARVTGLKGIYRESRIHALNQKEIGIRFAAKQGKKYEDMNLIICHIGGGISVTAHRMGKMVDSNDIANGDGPMAPTRCGQLPVKDVVTMCYSGKYTENEMREKYLEVINREPQKRITRYAAGIMGGTGFAVFFGCNLRDAVIAFIVSVMIVAVGDWLAKRESNLLVYNGILAFISEVIIIGALKMGIAEHPDRIMIGIVMLLISGLSTTNGIRDLLQRDFISGFINIMNSLLGAAGIAFGIGLAIILFHEGYSDHFILNHSVSIQLLSCTVACTGFALWFKIRGKQVWYNSIGAFFTWAIYVAVYAVKPSNFLATMIAAGFVGFYAFIMSRVNKAPSTIFLTASVFPLIPGPNLYYVMYGCVSQDPQMVFDETIILLATCLAIAFGFIIVDVASRSIMHAMKREYHIGKSALNLPLIGGKK